MTIESAKVGTSTTLDQTSWTQVNGMTLTPGAGNYLAIFTMEVEFTTAGGNTLDVQIYVNGSPQAHTIRDIQDNSSLPDMNTCILTTCYVQPGASQIVDVRYQVDGGSYTAWARELVLLPATGTNYQDTSLIPDSVNTGIWETVVSMIETPAAGNYLLVFSTSAISVADEVVGFRVSVDGSPLAHTERQSKIEGSAAPTKHSVLIACEVNVNGSQVVEIEWARISGSGIQQCLNRNMILIGKPAAQILEVTGTVTDNDVTTTDKQIDDMLVTDPGAREYLVIFSSYQYLGTLSAPGSGPNYSIRNAGAKVTDSDREFFHEDSIDNGYTPTFCAGKVTVVGATDDLQIYWQGSSSDSRDSFERTMVAVYEATYKLEGTTYDNAAQILGSVDCYLYKDNQDNTLTFIDHVVSHASLGTFAFTGLQNNDPNYLIVFIKDNGSNVFDCTDHNLTPEVE